MDLFLLSIRKNISSCFLILLDKLCLSQTESLEYGEANKVKMSTVASVTLQRKKLVEGRVEMPSSSLQERGAQVPSTTGAGHALFQSHTAMQSRSDLQPAALASLLPGEQGLCPLRSLLPC